MKRRIILAVPLVIAISVLLTAAPTVPVASADKEVFTLMITGPEAHAEWWINKGPCVQGHVTLDLWQHFGIGTEGPLARKTTVEISAMENDWCNYTFANQEAWGDFPNDVYAAPGTGLDSTYLVGRLPITFSYNKPPGGYMDVNLTWLGTGQTTRIKEREMQVEKGGLVYQCHANVRQRDAVSSGEILIDGINVAPDPSSSALLEWVDPSGCVFLPQ